MGWEEWLKDLKGIEDLKSQMQSGNMGTEVQDALESWADECIAYWFGKVRQDRTPIPEEARESIVKIINQAGERWVGIQVQQWEVVMALLCGLLRSEPIHPMNAMIQAMLVGFTLRDMPDGV